MVAITAKALTTLLPHSHLSLMPTSSPSKPTKALEDRVINSIQAGNLYDDMQQKIINVNKKPMKKAEKNFS